VHGRLVGHRVQLRPAGLQGRAQQRRVVPVGGYGHDAQRDAQASTSVERFSPPFRGSTGDGPARCPPHGAFVIAPSTLRSPYGSEG
jgi:hypothetical protein